MNWRQLDPWSVFNLMRKNSQRGVFLDGWGPNQSTLMAVDFEVIAFGRENSTWEQFEAALAGAQAQGLCFALVGYGASRFFDHARVHHQDSAHVSWVIASLNSWMEWHANRGYVLHAFPEPNWKMEPTELLCQVGELQFPVTQETYAQQVLRAKEYILAGDTFQVNLAHRVEFEIKGDPLALYSKIKARNPSPYAGCFFDQSLDLSLISNSPELLFEIQGQRCITKPIAGTRRRGHSAEEDHRLLQELLESPKEQAEHLMLVDLERNDLGRVAEYGSVEVTDFMGIEQYSHVTHIVSTVEATLAPNQKAPQVLRALFPGGTITGAPKLRSMEIIAELEKYPRGLYTGSMGWWDQKGNACFNILIRGVQVTAGRGELHVGAGIVHDSIPEQEYKETLNKAAAWKSVLT